MQNATTEADCRVIYTDIINGYSFDPDGEFVSKHFSEIDYSAVEIKRRKFLQEAKKQGLMSEAEKLDLLAIQGHWTKQDEEDYQKNQEAINSLYFSLRKLVIPQQIEFVEKTIEQKRKDNLYKWTTRSQLLHLTTEYYANKKSSEYHVLSSLYKDKECVIPLFSQEEIENLSVKDVENLSDLYKLIHSPFTEKNLKKVAVCPFFLNAYLTSSENPYFFFGKPVSQLTTYQLAVFSRGHYYKNIVEETTNRPPEEYYEDLDKIIQFYDREYSIILGKRNNNQLIK